MPDAYQYGSVRANSLDLRRSSGARDSRRTRAAAADPRPGGRQGGPRRGRPGRPGSYLLAGGTGTLHQPGAGYRARSSGVSRPAGTGQSLAMAQSGTAKLRRVRGL